MSPFPFQFGGGPRPLEGITQALNASRGYAFDASTWSSTVYIENRSFARFLYGRWATNQRAQNQFDMTRVTDLIPRWERIYQVYPLATDTPSSRRVRLAFKVQQASKEPWYQQVFDDLTSQMGPCFVQIVHTTVAQSRMIYPGFNGVVVGTVVFIGGATYSSAPTVTFSAPSSVGGITAAGTVVMTGSGSTQSVASITITNPGSGYDSPPTITFGSGTAAAYAITNANPYDVDGTTTIGVSSVDWASGVGYIAIQIQQPSGMTANQFQAYVNAGLQYLDGALPAWEQFGTFESVGFLLDEPNFGVSCLDS